jgi:16S rRNA (guanine(966)-N(2))-methyltransferase RsmD
MRITGGTARGSSLLGPKAKWTGIRPSSDRLREALFNIIAAEIPASRVLDLYAGTGSLGMEALSRGAETAVFVDQDPRALDLIQANLSRCRMHEQARLVRLDLSRPGTLGQLQRPFPRGFHLIFLDPPYCQDQAAQTLRQLAQGVLLEQAALVVAEVEKNEKLSQHYGGLHLLDRRVYGASSLWFYRSTSEKKPCLHS